MSKHDACRRSTTRTPRARAAAASSQPHRSVGLSHVVPQLPLCRTHASERLACQRWCRPTACQHQRPEPQLMGRGTACAHPQMPCIVCCTAHTTISPQAFHMQRQATHTARPSVICRDEPRSAPCLPFTADRAREIQKNTPMLPHIALQHG